MRTKLLIALLLLLPLRCFGSVGFASTGLYACTTAPAIDSANQNAGTIITWLYPTSTTTADSFFRKNGFFANTTASGVLQFSAPRSTTSLLATANNGSYPAFKLNAWSYLAFSWDANGSNGNQQIWDGNLTTPVNEVTAYGLQRVGSGTVTNNSAFNFNLGNTDNGSTPMQGRIAVFGMWNRRLSLGELRDQQFNPHVTSGNIFLVWLGMAGGLTGTQPDYSGQKNNCTASSTPNLSIFPNVPLVAPFAYASESASDNAVAFNFVDELIALRDDFTRGLFAFISNFKI